MPVLSGVPQGSVLGPLLFLIYINDVLTIEMSGGSVLNLFADDMLLFKSMRSNEDLCKLQSDINLVSEWVNSNFLTFNSSKCKCMLVTKKRTNYIQSVQFYLNNVILEQVKSFKYLGVLISSDLSWSAHID